MSCWKSQLMPALLFIAVIAPGNQAFSNAGINESEFPASPDNWKFQISPYVPGMVSYEFAYPDVYDVYHASISAQVVYFDNSEERVAAGKARPYSKARDELHAPFKNNDDYEAHALVTQGEYKATVYSRKDFMSYSASGYDRLPLIKVIYYHSTKAGWASLGFTGL